MNTAVNTAHRPAAELLSSRSRSPAAELLSPRSRSPQYLAKPGSRPYCSAQPQRVSLPPFADWAPAGLEEKHAPKLPEAFWTRHGLSGNSKACGVVGRPNEPTKWGDW